VLEEGGSMGVPIAVTAGEEQQGMHHLVQQGVHHVAARSVLQQRL